MVYLPTGADPEWALYTFRQPWLKSEPAAGGVMQVQLAQVPQDELWLVERLTVSSTSTAKTQARLYLDTIEPSRLIDGTRSGNFDVADNAAPIQLPGGSILICQWTGADNGTVGTLRAQLRILRQRVF